MIRAIAASGGLIGAVAVAGYIAQDEPSITRWVDHIDHLVNMAGIDHVAIGGDFYDDIAVMGASHDIAAWGPAGGLGALRVPGMRSWEDLPGLTAELLSRGYAEADMSKIFRENALRVVGDVIGG
jgi:membrane dipeptidase